MRNAWENYPVNALAGMWKKMARNHNVKLKNRLNPEARDIRIVLKTKAS